jgi:hypothetical protein
MSVVLAACAAGQHAGPRGHAERLALFAAVRADKTDYDGWDDDNECWNCGGEGRVNDCVDGCCVDQDDIYCPYCSKRCDVCNPPKRRTEEPVSEEQREG